MAEGVAVVIAERALRRCTDMGKDKRGGGLGGYSLEVDTVPSWCGRGKDARLWAKLAVGVVSNSKSITCQGKSADEQNA
jgi:hypothetical protein